MTVPLRINRTAACVLAVLALLLIAVAAAAPAKLSAEDARRQREGIETRGGVRPEPWILSYGDG